MQNNRWLARGDVSKPSCADWASLRESTARARVSDAQDRESRSSSSSETRADGFGRRSGSFLDLRHNYLPFTAPSVVSSGAAGRARLARNTTHSALHRLVCNNNACWAHV